MSSRKRHIDHTIADIIRLKPTWWKNKQSNLDDSLAKLRHIHTLMEHGAGHIAAVPFHELFQENWDLAALSMQDVNRCIAEYRETTPISSPAPTNAPVVTRFSLVPQESFREGLKPAMHSYKDRIHTLKYEIERQERDATSYRNQIEEYHRYLHECSVRAAQLEQELEQVEIMQDSGSESSIDKEKLALLKTIPDQWVVVDMDSERFTIVRRTPITLNYLNSASGMCKTLYLGFMGMSFSYDLQCLDSFHVADYINFSTTRIHPHINGNHICWGNQSRRADRCRENRDYKGYFELLESILTTYCPDNPYIAFANLERARNRKYTVINTNLFGGSSSRRRQSTTWAATNREALVRMFALSASNRFVERISEAFGTTLATPHLQERKKRFAAFCKTEFSKVWLPDIHASINRTLEDIGAVDGNTLANLLKGQGIRVADRDCLKRMGVTSSGDSDVYWPYIRLLVMIYGSLPLANGQVLSSEYYQTHTYRLKSFGDTYYKTVNMVRVNRADGDEYNTRTMDLCSYNDGIEVTQAKPLDQALAQMAPPAPTPVPADEDEDFNEDEIFDYGPESGEDCEHEYDSNGECEICGMYNADYDTRVNDEDEEDRYADVPF